MKFSSRHPAAVALLAVACVDREKPPALEEVARFDAAITATEEAKLVASDADLNDNFGNAAAVSGDTAIVGANVAGSAAYVFVRSGSVWVDQQKLTASDGVNNDFFGTSVAISGDTAVVGASTDDDGDETDAGSAYVFVRSGSVWTQQQKLVASDAAEGDFFGSSVAISGDTVLVGAVLDDNPLPDNGSAYVFVRSGSTWTQQQKLVADDGIPFSFFGSVALDGDTALVTEGGVNQVWSAHVFVRSGSIWAKQQKLTPSDLAAGEELFTAAIDGDTAIVGAPGDTTPGGSAYVFVRAGSVWSEQQKLSASDATSLDGFGASIAVAGDTSVVGAVAVDDSAYVFSRSGSVWTEELKLTGDADFSGFGASADISGDTVVIGAPAGQVGGIQTGTAYAFLLSEGGEPVGGAGTGGAGEAGGEVAAAGGMGEGGSTSSSGSAAGGSGASPPDGDGETGGCATTDAPGSAGGAAWLFAALVALAARRRA